MKTIIGMFLAVIAFVLLVDIAQAQTSVSVDINKSKLSWVWEQGNGGPADEFLVKCGQTSKTYTKITSVPSTARELAVKDAITGIGNWFCAVSAKNGFGESGLTAEVAFAAGTVPVPPGNLVIQAQ